ncbi:YciI family protein [Steroidobacter cummioxidans]|uniref:YciI family protein n=1 Tax=Steroidobacter cummioxidans TaxID=1803913 RepID=UPI000E3188B3|nr:YciI family protein [Steroidobacter cummioxidans]
MHMHKIGRRVLFRLSFAGAAAFLMRPFAAHSAEQAPPKASLYLAMYRPGPAWIEGQPTASQPLREHGRYILQLHLQGKLRLAGGFPEDGGAAVFEAESDAIAQSIIAADPAVTTGLMECTLRRWNVQDWDAIARRVK